MLVEVCDIKIFYQNEYVCRKFQFFKCGALGYINISWDNMKGDCGCVKLTKLSATIARNEIVNSHKFVHLFIIYYINRFLLSYIQETK